MSTLKKLTNLLKEAKAEFVAIQKHTAEKNHDFLMGFRGWKMEQFYDRFGVSYTKKFNNSVLDRSARKTSQYKACMKFYDRVFSIHKDKQTHVSRKVDAAKKYFDSKTVSLSERVDRKANNPSNIRLVVQPHLEYNINIRIECDGVVFWARTIFVGESIDGKRAHLRYIITSKK